MASNEMRAVAENKTFQFRVRYFLEKAAIAVMAELLNTAGHTERVVYAKEVLGGSADYYSATIAVLTNSTVAAAGKATTDNDLEFTVNSMFSHFAGFETGAAS